MQTSMLTIAAVIVLSGSTMNMACFNPNDRAVASSLDDRPGRASFAFDQSTVIPDGLAEGVTIGPLAVVGDAATIHDVVLGLEIAHAYAGDLHLVLHYDSDLDGGFDASSAVDLHLARAGDPEAEEMYAIPVELGGTYYFQDEGWLAAGEDVSFAAAFDGQPSGGCFYLTVIDDGAGNTGSVARWMVEVGEVAGSAGAGRIASFQSSSDM